MPLSADVAEESLITSNARDVHPADTLRLPLDAVPYKSRSIYLIDGWGKKAIRRTTTGTGRMRHLSIIQRK